MRKKNSIRYFIVMHFLYRFLLWRNLGNFLQKSTKTEKSANYILFDGAWPHKLIFLTKRHTKSQNGS